MLDSALTADVPLGPFEGAPMTVHSSKGKTTKLHAAKTCPQLRARDIATASVPLNVETIGRMCSRCAQWGAWSRPGTGLGVFLRALGGVGLLYQLQCHTGPDEDTDWDEPEVLAAAKLLCEPEADIDDDQEEEEEDGEGREAERLQDCVFSAWKRAATSLHQAQATAAMFPWLADWAEPKLAVKIQYLETLRAQAALFVDTEGLRAAAAAELLGEPELPSSDPAFTAVGSHDEITRSLKTLWREWQEEAASGWGRPSERTYISSHLTHGMRPNRKGYAQARAGVDELVASWEELAQIAAKAADPVPQRLVTVRLSEVVEDPSYRHERGFLHDLDDWTTGVLLTHLTAADWGRRTLTLKVPALVADRLLASHPSGLTCEAGTAGPETPTGAEAGASSQHVRPGIFDDTPVYDRQPLAADHLRALRAVSADRDQLYLVFSVGAGTEVLPLTTVEKRLAAEWQGTILASASDLPVSVVEAWVREIGRRPEDGESIWSAPVHDPHDPRFGADLGLADGDRATAWLRHGGESVEYDLRCLAMARGAADLRTLDDSRDREERRRTVPIAVWHGLLATTRHLDLRPFKAPGTDRWHGGSGIPLGVLAEVQVYTTDAKPGWNRRGHSAFCSHSGERGLSADDDLLTIADLLSRDGFDWCSKCHGFAVRRFTDSQVSYYRAAHRLHAVVKRLDRDGGATGGTNGESLAAELSELSEWHPIGETYWDSPDSWRWTEIIRDLRHRLANGHGTR
ncbi:hypothetical protein [Kitasatospora sp. NPDC091276]|uniref:hypothetical protein n=1 Tax=Kitasatospora sp. NPDC091276 TaxID=3155300 RepID=UPI00342B3420